MSWNVISRMFHENKKWIEKIPVPVILLAIFFLSLSLRMTPSLMDAPWEPQYDSYWFFRYAKTVVDNNGTLPAWDSLSYYPPGRPVDKSTQFYVHLLAYSFMFIKKFVPDITLVYVAKAVPAILTSLSIFPAYYIGKYLSGRRAGLLAALFIGVSPSILVRTGADPDNDGSVVFLTMLSFYSMIKLIKRPSFKNSAIAIASLTMFALSWYPFWYVYIISFGGLVANMIITAAYSSYKKEPFTKELDSFKTRMKYFAIVLAGIIVIPFIFGANTISYFGGFLMFGTDPQASSIVNISVAELQKLDIFSTSGWNQIIGRSPGLSFLAMIAGLIPSLLALPIEIVAIAAFAYIAYRMYKKNLFWSLIFSANTMLFAYLLLQSFITNKSAIDLALFAELSTFLLLLALAFNTSYKKDHALGAVLMFWIVFTFYAISSGIRFTLLFSMASSMGIAVGLGELCAVPNSHASGTHEKTLQKTTGSTQ